MLLIDLYDSNMQAICPVDKPDTPDFNLVGRRITYKPGKVIIEGYLLLSIYKSPIVLHFVVTIWEETKEARINVFRADMDQVIPSCNEEVKVDRQAFVNYLAAGRSFACDIRLMNGTQNGTATPLFTSFEFVSSPVEHTTGTPDDNIAIVLITNGRAYDLKLGRGNNVDVLVLDTDDSDSETN